MASRSPHVLFVSHNANRGGAPILLLQLISEFKKQSTIPFQIILMEDGPLSNEFRKLGKTHVWPRTGSRLKVILKGLLILSAIRKSTIVFSNTITNGHFHKKLLFLRAKFITYVHELEIATRALTSATSLGIVLEHTDLFFACSDAVRQNLIHRHQVSANKIDLLYGSAPVVDAAQISDKAGMDVLKNQLNIPAGSFLVGAVGECEWRKGFDLFPVLAKTFNSMFPESRAHFVWLGVRSDRMNYFANMEDLQKFGLHGSLTLVPHSHEFRKYLSLLDIHLLMSREDPFPLVVLEAASLSIPTISFSDNGGATEFISDGAGALVPYGDLIAFARAIHDLESDSDCRRLLGQKAKEKVLFGYRISDSVTRIIEQITIWTA